MGPGLHFLKHLDSSLVEEAINERIIIRSFVFIRFDLFVQFRPEVAHPDEYGSAGPACPWVEMRQDMQDVD